MSPAPPDDPQDDDEEGTAILRLDARALAEPAPPKPFLVFLAGGDAGRMIRVDRELTLGRGARATVQLSGDGVSRAHARLYRDGASTLIEDLGSTNGTQVNGETIRAPRRLRDGDKIQLGASFLLKFSLQDELDQRFQQQLFDAALRDPLTNAYNRRALLERMGADLAHANRHGEPYALVLWDLDHFKRINDGHGHLAGDHVLRGFAERVDDLIRQGDFFARYGGEEFALACRSTDAAQARALCERIRSAVEAEPFEHEGLRLRVTASAGIAVHRAEQTAAQLIGRADAALYEAKRAGRNQVRVAD
jgi:two-component system, cell cycle response regulator